MRDRVDREHPPPLGRRGCSPCLCRGEGRWQLGVVAVRVFSAPGRIMRGKNNTLGVGPIRGVESRGMLGSEAELQLSENHDGIIELPADAPVGAAYVQW